MQNHFNKRFEPVFRRFSSFSQEKAEKIGGFFAYLLEENQKVNLSGYHTFAELVQHYLLDSMELGERILQENKEIIDVGTGAGIPGMILAILDETRHFYLLDAVKKKTDFLERVCMRLDMRNCKVLHGRAEDLAHRDDLREKVDCATAKAVGTLSAVLEWSSGFVKVGGTMVFPRGDEKEEIREYIWRKNLGITLSKVESYHLEGYNQPFYFYHFKKVAPTLDKYPRTPKKIRNHPL